MSYIEEYQVVTNGRNLATFETLEEAIEELNYRKSQNIPNSTISIYDMEGEELVCVSLDQNGNETEDSETMIEELLIA